MFLNLEKNKIYKVIYNNNNIDYFTFIQINDEMTHGIDVFTKEEYNLKQLSSIILDYKQDEYKHALKLYSVFNNKNIFILKNPNDLIIDLDLNYILRFFELPTSSIIFEENIEESILNNVISKTESFFSRYIDTNSLSVYIKQIKKFKQINDILMFVPKEFLSKKTPFWVDEIVYYGNYNPIYSFSIEDIELCNKFDLNILDSIKNRESFFNKIEEKIIEIKEYQKQCYINHNKSLLLKRISQALLTLENEKFIAEKENDEELSFEINIIKSEIKKIEENIDKIDFFNYPFWPDLLMPDQSQIFFEDGSEFALEQLKWINNKCDIINLNIKYGI